MSCSSVCQVDQFSGHDVIQLEFQVITVVSVLFLLLVALVWYWASRPLPIKDD